MQNFLKTLFGGVILLLMLFGIAIVMAVPTYLIWNWIMPDIFTSLHKITLGQALGLNMLSAILFKSSSSNSKN